MRVLKPLLVAFLIIVAICVIGAAILIHKGFHANATPSIAEATDTANAGSSCRFSAAELLGTRRVPVSGFPRNLIFYKVEDREVFVLGVIHGARDLENLFAR